VSGRPLRPSDQKLPSSLLSAGTTSPPEEHAAATSDQARFVRQVSVFPEREAYAMIQQGRATLLGLRGALIAGTITEAGAVTNFNDDILELFSGGEIRLPVGT
jgi:hypothetical protein